MVELTAFAAQARDFVASHYPRREQTSATDCVQYAVVPDISPEMGGTELGEHLAWRKTCFDAGFGWVDGPVEYGGRGLSGAHAAVYREIERDHAVPDDVYTRFSVSILCPSLADHASSGLKDEVLAALRRTDIVSCQLFSEPEAGSHMSATRTIARQDGDRWVVNGQKIWTSGTHYSQMGLLLARTTPRSKGTIGLSTFLIDLDQPGVEVRPIRQLTGGAAFSEVFFTDAEVADSRRVGEVGMGWSVVIATMQYERSAIGAEATVDIHLARQLVSLARATGRWADPAIREAIAEAHLRAEANRLLTQRYARAGEVKGTPGPEMSLSKLLLTDNLQRISSLAQDLLGEAMWGDEGVPGYYAWRELALTLPGLRIGGGTDEIMRDIVAHRVLGLPR